MNVTCLINPVFSGLKHAVKFQLMLDKEGDLRFSGINRFLSLISLEILLVIITPEICHGNYTYFDTY